MVAGIGSTARTRGFLFADLRGYTEFVERRGDRAAASMLETFRVMVRRAVADHEGAEIRTEGDNAYVVFPSVGGAVACGLEIVRLAAASPGPWGGAIRVGVGVHAGETVETSEGFIGSVVNIAARVCARAPAGEVLVTDTVRALTRTSLDVNFEPRGAPLLKGLAEAIPLFSVQVAPGGPAGAEGLLPTKSRNPYKGLRPFEESDSGDFFGREALTARLVERLGEVSRSGRLLTIVGPSGSGKSSVVRAGLVPALRRGALPGSERWRIAIMSPGGRPLAELAAALRRGAGSRRLERAAQLEGAGQIGAALERALPVGVERLVLVVDQTEELFTLTRDAAVRTGFIDGLLGALAAPEGRLLVVLTIRADFLDRPLAWPGLGELVRSGLEVVTPMSRAELELAINRPAQAAGVELEPGLAAEVIADVASAAEALPLLQYALTVLFEESDGRRLTRDGYAAIGGVAGALGRRAEETWESLPPESRAVARRVLLRLVAAGDGGGPIGRRVARADLAAGPAATAAGEPGSEADADADAPAGGEAGRVEEVLDAFGRCRLLAFDRDAASGEPTVEVAHESVLLRWPRLVGWIEQQREDIWMRRRLEDAAVEWVRAGHDEGFLLTGSRLQLFAGWAHTTDLGLTAAEHALLAASIAGRRRHEEEEARRTAYEHVLEGRSRRRLRRLVAVLAAFSLIAGLLLVVVFRQGQAAGEQEAIARARELAAASVGNLHADPQLSLLLGVEAARATLDRGYVVEEAMDSLHWALQASPAGYPVTGGPVAVRSGPGGSQGAFLIPLGQLVRLARDRAGRTLTAQECATYLHEPCLPGDLPGVEGDLAVQTSRGRLPVERLATSGLSGTRVQVLLPAELAPALAGFPSGGAIAVVRQSGEESDLESLAPGDLPDLAIVSRPALVASLVRAGRLVELSRFVDPASLRSRLGDGLLSFVMLTPGGAGGGSPGLYGAPVAASLDDLVWYPKAAFQNAGYRVPTTWAELLELTERMVADGHTPWCLGTAGSNGAAPGTAAAGWVEDLLLSANGPSVFARWTNGELSFTDPAMRAAFRRFGRLAFGDGFVLGGRASIALIPQEMAAWPLARAPGDPSCWLYRGSGTERQAWPASVTAAVAAFPLPPVDPQFADAARGELDTLVVFHDRPEVRELVGWLLSQESAAQLDGAPEAAGVVSLAAAGGAPIRDQADGEQRLRLQRALQAGGFRPAGGGLLAAATASAFARATLGYLAEGDRALDSILSDLQSGRSGVPIASTSSPLQTTVTFDGTSCVYRGPSVLPAGARLAFEFVQDASREPASLRLLAVKAGTTWQQVQAGGRVSYILPPWVDEDATSLVISGSGTGFVDLAEPQSDDGFAVECVTATLRYVPAALIRLAAP